MSDKVEVRYNGIGFFGFLTLLFIALKLTGYIDWSWWLVIAPAFAPILFIVGFIVIVAVPALILGAIVLILEAFRK